MGDADGHAGGGGALPLPPNGPRARLELRMRRLARREPKVQLGTAPQEPHLARGVRRNTTLEPFTIGLRAGGFDNIVPGIG